MERNMDESRKAFESWLMEEFGYRQDYLEYWRGEGDYKSHPDLRSRWQGWKASRAAIELEIDWPEANDDTWMDGEDGAYARGHEDGKDKVVIAVRKAIRAAGIKVKE